MGIDAELLYKGNFFGALETTSKEWNTLQGAPIINLEDPEKIRHIFPVGVMKSDLSKDEYFVSGECETVFTACCWASTITETRRRILRTLEGTNFPTMVYDPNMQLSSTRPFQVLKERNYVHG